MKDGDVTESNCLAEWGIVSKGDLSLVFTLGIRIRVCLELAEEGRVLTVEGAGVGSTESGERHCQQRPERTGCGQRQGGQAHLDFI